MSIIYYDAILDNFVSHNKCIPYKIKKGYTHRVGATYWNGYWHKAYRVLDIDEKGYIKVLWLDDNTESVHFTQLDYRRDYELKRFKDSYFGNVIDNKVSYRGAVIKALLCSGSIFNQKVSDDLYRKYYINTNKPLNDRTYYFIYHKFDKIIIVRDTKKSPKRRDERKDEQ